MKWQTEDIIAGLLAGKKQFLARAITLAESAREEHKEQAKKILERVLSERRDTVRIGITGVPGVGKSTFIETFGLQLIERGHKVAVLAIDPSSSKTRGSILGDKTRMEKLGVHPQAFIRPTASGSHLGGLSAATQQVIYLCEAAGFDRIIVETVGVGQSETEVRHVCDFFLLLMLAGAGDELQGIKRGIMEMCDGMVIHKADGDNLVNAKSARNQYAKALHFLPKGAGGWSPQVLTASSYEGTGFEDIHQMIEQFVQKMQANGFFAENRNQQSLHIFESGVAKEILGLLQHNDSFSAHSAQLREEILSGRITAYQAVAEIGKHLQLVWKSAD